MDVGKELNGFLLISIDLPHVDEVLSQGHGVRVARNGDGPVSAATFTLLAI